MARFRGGSHGFTVSIVHHLKRASESIFNRDHHLERAAHNFRRLARLRLDPPAEPSKLDRLAAWSSRSGGAS